MARFSKATLNIPDLHPIVAMHALLVGLHLGKFLDTLYTNPPANIDELRNRAARYINIDENVDVRRKIMKTSEVLTSEHIHIPKENELGDLKIIQP